MSQIITNPGSMVSFSRTVAECSERLKKEEMHLFADLNELGATWKDAKYQKFDRLITDSSRELAAFHSASQRYSDYLVRKANAAKRFLEA